MLKSKILAELEDSKGRPISGQAMADMLGVTRSAVSKAVSQLRADGYSISSSTGSGYILDKDCDILSVAGINRYLNNCRYSITVLDTVDSTNSEMKRRAADGAADGEVVIARCQTAGRGRMGRTFFSPNDCGVYISLLIRPQLRAEDALRITTSAAVAVARALAKMGVEAQIKWVNDLFLGERKICGILTEAALDIESGGIGYVVLGIGVNVNAAENGFPAELSQIAGVAFTDSVADAKNRLAANILNELAAIDGQWLSLDLLCEYRRRSMLIGNTVEVYDPMGNYLAEVLTVDDDAHLIVRDCAGKEHCLKSGEVSVRRVTNE